MVEVDRRPVPGETLLARAHHSFGGGKGANQALAAARAGAATTLVGRVGDDSWALEALRGLDAVDTSWVRPAAAAPTGAAFITLTPDGENSIVVSPGANALVDPAFVEEAGGAIRAADVLCTVLEIPLAAARRGCELAREAEVRVVLTPAPATPEARALLPLVDVAIANDVEARALGGSPEGLLELGAAAVVVTRGPGGALVLDADGSRHVAAFDAGPVVDTTGAGDALAGTVAARLAAGDDLTSAVGHGVRAAGIAVTRRGARPL